ncbi:MAG: amino-acid N-acetyltransferase [Spirochaetales bacterium]|nr:amino-acid N-acetyltransferase [Spirochaetales bacterium]
MDKIQESEAPPAQVETIREVFQYLHRFAGKTFVIKIDYKIIEDPHFSILMADIARLHEVGVRVVLIPGAKERIDDILAVYRIEDRIIGGVRATSNEAIPFIKMAAFDVANRLMTCLSGSEINAVIGNWVRARGIGLVDGVDYQSAGLVERILTKEICNLTDDGFVPILPCIGWSPAGRPYNIASGELAVVTASRLGAEKLFFITADDGIFARDYAVPDGIPVAPTGRISNFSLTDLEVFFAANPGRPRPDLLEYARRACEAGVERVHILDGRKDGVLLKEIFSNLGSGTMVYSNRYSGIRPMRQNDISDVLRVMKPFVDQGILVSRTEETLAETFRDYIVFEVDGAIHASAALHRFPESLGEIAAIAVDENYSHLSVGPRLVDYLCELARKSGLTKVFVLTTRTTDWFLSLGFEEGDLSSLPEKKRSSYNLARKSRILVKSLQ